MSAVGGGFKISVSRLNTAPSAIKTVSTSSTPRSVNHAKTIRVIPPRPEIYRERDKGKLAERFENTCKLEGKHFTYEKDVEPLVAALVKE